MEGIELGKAISTYGIPIVTGMFLVLICWLVRYFVVNFMEIFKKEIPKLGKIVKEDSDNTVKVTESVNKLTGVISNHLVHNIDKLTTEIQRMNEKK